MCASPRTAPSTRATPTMPHIVEMKARSGCCAVTASIFVAAVSSLGETAKPASSSNGAAIMQTPANVLRKCCESETGIKPSFGFESIALRTYPRTLRLLRVPSARFYSGQGAFRNWSQGGLVDRLTRLMRRLIPILTAALALALAPPAGATTETASSGAVSAKFSWTQKSDFQYTGLHLTITRAGAAAFDGPVPPSCTDPDCGFQPGGFGRTSSVLVTDLDGDGEPEVVVGVYSGGAHCCVFAEIYSYVPATGTYANFEQNFGGGYNLKDLNGDLRPELKATDIRFDEAFTAHAASLQPIQIWAFRDGRLVDVTRSFPSLVKRDAARALKLYKKERKRDFDVRGILGAYVADEYLLRKSKSASRVLSKALKRGDLSQPKGTGFASGKSYVRRLKKLLKKYGYAG